ncbi:MAG TPA: histidine kinase dimerization/phosphoacceptor domain -containing protein [Bradyrhizobium sp.]
MLKRQFSDTKDACALAQAIVDTVREPLLVLDHDLRVVAASRSFYLTFSVTADDVLGKPIYELGDGAWNIPALKASLGDVLSKKIVMTDFELEHTFPVIGPRALRLNAREVFHEGGAHRTVLLGFEDITTQRDLARRNDELLHQKDVLLEEFQHRVGNSLAIIASIISLKARSVDSEEARRHLDDARDRVISYATVQQSLHTSANSGFIELGPHFTKLCQAISRSMIGDNQRIRIEAHGGGRATTGEAESLGLILTELVINSLKHGFTEQTTDGLITVAYTASEDGWKLSVSDNGIGSKSNAIDRPRSGLGTGIVKALARQLGAEVTTAAGQPGTIVSVARTAIVTRAGSAGADAMSAASRMVGVA